MEGRIMGFIVFCMIGGMFLCWAVYTWFSKKPKPMGFWANAENAPAKMKSAVTTTLFNIENVELFLISNWLFVNDSVSVKSVFR